MQIRFRYFRLFQHSNWIEMNEIGWKIFKKNSSDVKSLTPSVGSFSQRCVQRGNGERDKKRPCLSSAGASSWPRPAAKSGRCTTQSDLCGWMQRMRLFADGPTMCGCASHNPSSSDVFKIFVGLCSTVRTLLPLVWWVGPEFRPNFPFLIR